MIERVTKFSEDRVYRYTLWREWAGDGSPFMLNAKTGHQPAFVMFIGLNPSTADEVKDDPTIRRCKDFAKRWGYGAMVMTNIFAFRATDPEVMKAHPAPIGEQSVTGELNDDILVDHALHAGIVVCAWGKHGSHMFRGLRVKRLLISNGVDLKCFKLNKDGSPEHPLYQPASRVPIPFVLS